VGPLVVVILAAVIAGFALDTSFGVIRSAELPAGDLNETALLGGLERDFNSDFRGGKLTAFMGGVKVDLRNAQMERGEAVLDVASVMGGVQILVPDSWTVVSKVDTVMGGYVDKTRRPAAESKRLILKGSVLMGGLEVLN
jgi:hypothetical protein